MLGLEPLLLCQFFPTSPTIPTSLKPVLLILCCTLCVNIYVTRIKNGNGEVWVLRLKGYLRCLWELWDIGALEFRRYYYQFMMIVWVWIGISILISILVRELIWIEYFHINVCTSRVWVLWLWCVWLLIMHTYRAICLYSHHYCYVCIYIHIYIHIHTYLATSPGCLKPGPKPRWPLAD